MVYVWLTEAYEKNGDHEKAQMARKKAKELEQKGIKPSKP